ncbi:MAG TPA: phosphotransferase family protein [Actinomycetota bacterium]|nr:phosphotransferase family protein [Actinomycetota bacterium]
MRSAPELEPLVDPEGLTSYLRDRFPDSASESVEVERHMAGHSNETFFVRFGERDWVLRRPPRGAFLPTAHDVAREYRVLSALAGTGVRAPRPVLFCEDTAVIGAPFYLMERVDGAVIRDVLPEPFASDESLRRGLGDELVDALVELHAVDWRSVGLEGFGKPSGYLERQVRRWSGQLELTEPLTRKVPELHAATDWLRRNLNGVPDTPPTIVHGDYKMDNVMYAPVAPARLIAVLDWEMSTIGDPLADLGWMVSFWREPGDPVAIDLEGKGPTRLPGFQRRDDLILRYEERSRRQVGDLTFHMVLAVWKLAILLEGSYARHLAGLTDDSFFAQMEEGVPLLAQRALNLASQ